ncbi:O-antigen polymerase [Emticicia oligotrophica DSM 17448]|uniref:O-antigen polymerase n=1 Tax=Emticicia oligotrophica (strain DSM 17448 / CIP 109782 / MTCC 6937 / GPTSA100-15) TaxID=929562 RepID=A0ABM5N789_EMTOG|nr:O-antigen ligase family protein [Emticicia oligotrophica]AFK05416.1 O-antigen polymerase [Emticicia oligotrophica DSM 17448]
MPFDIFTIFLILLHSSALGKIILLKLLMNSCVLYQILKQFNSVSKFCTSKNNKSLIGIMILFLISLVRTSNPSLDFFNILYKFLTNLLMFLYIITIGCKYIRLGTFFEFQNILQKLIIFPFSIFCFINFILYYFQIKLDLDEAISYQEASPALLLANIGINILRVKYPLATGYNSFASVIGLVFMLQILLILFTKFSVIRVICLTLLLITLVPIDSRMSIFIPILISLFVFLFKGSSFSYNRILFSISPFIYFILPVVLSVIMPILLGNVNNLQRGDDESELIRFTIWTVSLNFFLSFEIFQLIGYGEFGHFGSNISLQWANIFSSWTNNNLITTHNSIFAILFDMGYIGLICFMQCNFRIIYLIKKLYSLFRLESIIVGSMLLYCSIVGSTESLMGFYFPNFLLIFFIVSVSFFQLATKVKFD